MAELRPRLSAWRAGLLFAIGVQAWPVPPEAAGTDASITFNRHVAPILFRNCSGCHRPGESAPFSLLNYSDARRHAKELVEVTSQRLMPPWLPEDGHEALLDVRRLSEGDLETIRQWAIGGTAEGAAGDLPPTPTWTEGWQLGTPDVVVTSPEPFLLPAEARDVYRNFVLPIPTTARRYVRAFEFRPSSRAVHHAFLRLDGSGESRRMDERDPGPGFGGMEVPPSAESPAGHFLSWQPGRIPSVLPDGLSWPLPAGVDLVLLAHLQPVGKPEPVRPTVGFYFTDVPPTNTPTKLGLRCYTIDIPAGATNYTIEESLVLPVGTRVLAVLPHAHYLARRLEAFARLPDGNRRILLRIPEWDFKWQSDFRFANPVTLPAGTTLGLTYTYDNSTNNVRNPHHPPERVQWGLQTSDEMGELWFQVLATKESDQGTLENLAQARNVRAIADLSQFRLRQNPSDAEAMTELAKTRLAYRDAAGASSLLHQALALQPSFADAHYHLGLILLEERKYAPAESEFLAAIQSRPDHYQARANAGLCCLNQRKFDEAAIHFREVLRLHPGDAIARRNLDLVARLRQRSGNSP